MYRGTDELTEADLIRLKQLWRGSHFAHAHRHFSPHTCARCKSCPWIPNGCDGVIDWDAEGPWPTYDDFHMGAVERAFVMVSIDYIRWRVWDVLKEGAILSQMAGQEKEGRHDIKVKYGDEPVLWTPDRDYWWMVDKLNQTLFRRPANTRSIDLKREDLGDVILEEYYDQCSIRNSIRNLNLLNTGKLILPSQVPHLLRLRQEPVSYTHLTLPTILRV